MIFSLNTFSKLSLAMLALVSAAFFVVPAKEKVQAQANRTINFCFNPSNGDVILPSASGQCPSGASIISRPRSDIGICYGSASGSPPYTALQPNLNSSGQPLLDSAGTKCLADPADPNQAHIGTFKRFPTQQYNPGGGNTNTGGTGNTNTNTNTPKPPVQTQGDCETGFHKLGPLCIPNSPVGSNDSILGEQTVGGLAARIIRILLYFAGIVAVGMAIFGGYQVMTAAGNETQATNGRKTLTNAIIGLVIVILSYVIIQAVISFVT